MAADPSRNEQFIALVHANRNPGGLDEMMLRLGVDPPDQDHLFGTFCPEEWIWGAWRPVLGGT